MAFHDVIDGQLKIRWFRCFFLSVGRSRNCDDEQKN